jgi:hypothetical protein
VNRHDAGLPELGLSNVNTWRTAIKFDVAVPQAQSLAGTQTGTRQQADNGGDRMRT